MNKKTKERILSVAFGISIGVNLLFSRCDVYVVVKPKMIEDVYSGKIVRFDISILGSDSIDVGLNITNDKFLGELITYIDGGECVLETSADTSAISNYS